MDKRFVEVYAGAYASGKSETALNRALQFANKGEKITLVDLDTVEPAYTLRPISSELGNRGINVITQPDSFGLGEAASYITSMQMNCLSTDGNIIIDVGYGAGGLDILDIITGIEQEKNLKIYIVINTAKFETSDKESILEYLDFSKGSIQKEWKKFSGIISNTHLGDETTAEDIIKGYKKLKGAADEAGLPIIAIGIDKKLKSEFENKYDGVDIWVYDRMMPKALW